MAEEKSEKQAPDLALTMQFKDPLFPSIPVSKFVKEVNRLEKQKDAMFGSFANQMQVLQSCELELGSKIYQPSKVEDRKNRYHNVLPNDPYRVRLQGAQDYFNGSHVAGYRGKVNYVMTQAPISAAFVDFWQMCWQCNVSVILMLTKLVENNRTKADRYWPDTKADKYGDFVVAPDGEAVRLKYYVVRKFHLTLGTECRKIIQLQYTTWPDHGVPRDMTHVCELLLAYRAIRNQNTTQGKSHVVVHCSAGIGRTGTFVTIDTILDYLADTSVKLHKINVFAVVDTIRKQRPGAVQTKAQYEFCFKFLRWCLQNKAVLAKLTT